MKHYKSPTNELWAYEEDGSQDHLIPNDFVLVDDAEAQVLRDAATSRLLNSLDYKDRRAAEYPDFRIYLDAVVKGDSQQLQKYIDDCLAVKAKFPKS